MAIRSSTSPTRNVLRSQMSFVSQTVRMTVPYPISEDASWVVSRGDAVLLHGREVE